MTSIIITLLIITLKIPFINLLGDKGIGYYSTALIIYLLISTLIAYGLPKALSSQILLYGSKGQYKNLYNAIKSTFLFVLIAGIICGLLMFFGADFISTYFLKLEYCAPAIRALAPTPLLFGLTGTCHGINIGTRKSQVTKSARILQELLTAVFCVAALVIYIRISSLYEPVDGSFYASIGYTASIFVICIFMLIFFLKHKNKLKRFAHRNANSPKDSYWKITKNIISIMLPITLTLFIFHLSNFIDYAVFNRIMSVQGHKENSYIILLGILNGKYEFFISLPLIFVHKLSVSKQIEFKNIIVEEKLKKLNSNLNQYIRNTMLFIIPTVIIFILYSKPFMNLFFTGSNETPSILLKIGAISIMFYSLSIISNTVLNAANQYKTVIRNALISLIVQCIVLLIMLIIFKWGIVAVVIARIIFSASLCILNEHALREQTGHVLERQRAFATPFIASGIMGIVSLTLYFILKIFIADKIAVIFVLPFGIIAYILALVLLGGISQKEMYRLPGGKYFAPLCRKLHFIQ